MTAPHDTGPRATIERLRRAAVSGHALDRLPDLLASLATTAT